MSSGLYALIGVLVGAFVSGGLQYLMTRRTEDADFKVGRRLVLDELERMLLELGRLRKFKTTPAVLAEGFLDTSAWEEYRAVLARHIPGGWRGEELWKGLARIESTAALNLRPLIEAVSPGTPLLPELLQGIEDGYAACYGAYEELAGEPPHGEPPTETA